MRPRADLSRTRRPIRPAGLCGLQVLPFLVRRHEIPASWQRYRNAERRTSKASGDLKPHRLRSLAGHPRPGGIRPAEGEGHRKVWARLRSAWHARVSRKRVFRVSMRRDQPALRPSSAPHPGRWPKSPATGRATGVITHPPRTQCLHRRVRVSHRRRSRARSSAAAHRTHELSRMSANRSTSFAASRSQWGLPRLYASTLHPPCGAGRLVAEHGGITPQYLSDHFTNQQVLGHPANPTPSSPSKSSCRPTATASASIARRRNRCILVASNRNRVCDASATSSKLYNAQRRETSNRKTCSPAKLVRPVASPSRKHGLVSQIKGYTTNADTSSEYAAAQTRN